MFNVVSYTKLRMTVVSDGKVEATTGESLARSCRLVDDSRLESLLGFSLHLLSSLLLVVLSLHVLELSSQSFDFILVLVDLSLIHVELGSHSLHLTGLLLEVLLVDGELFSNFRAGLSSEEILKLDVELLLLLDNDILLDNFLSLLDQSLLQSHDLLEHFVSIWVSSFELSPSMAVQRVLELFREGLDLQSLGQQLLLQVVDLLSQVRDLRSLGLHDSQLGLVVTDFELEKSDILESLLILDFTSGESGLKNLDFLVKKGELVISPNELGTKDISLIDDVLEVLFELLDFFVGLLDDVSQLGDLVIQLISQFLSLLVLHLGVFELSSDLLNLLSVHSFLMMLLSQGFILGLNLILELRNLVRSDLELSLELGNLILSLNEVLGIQISIGSDSLIQVLLLLELSFELDVLFLELTDEVLLELNLLDHLHEVCIGLRCLVRESISILLELVDLSQKIGNVLLLHSTLLFELTNLVVLLGDVILVLKIVILSLFDGLGHHVSESDKINDLLLVLLGISPEMLNLSSQGIDTILGEILLQLCGFFLPGDSIIVITKTVVVSVEVLVILLQVSDLSSHLSNFDFLSELFLLEVDVISLRTFKGGVKAVEFL